MNKKQPVVITNEKALKIGQWFKEVFKEDMLWSSDDGKTALTGFTGWGGCMVCIDHPGQDYDGVSVSLNGNVADCSILMYMLATQFELQPIAPFYESRSGKIITGENAAQIQREEIIAYTAEMNEKRKSNIIVP